MKGDRKFAPWYSVWAIDAWADGENGWTWNDKARMFDFRTNAIDIKRTFLARLRKHLENPRNRGMGIHGGSGLGTGWYSVRWEDDHILELCRKCDVMPVYAAIRETPM